MCADKSKMEERRFFLDFIQIYRSLRSLWDVNHQNYNNREIKERDSKVLLRKYRERHPEASWKDVSRKLHSLRSNYKRELNRVNVQKKNGIKTEDASSRLWYFNAFSFLKDIENPNALTSQLRRQDETPKPKENPHGSPKAKRKREDTATDELILLLSERFKQKPSEFQKAGELWAMKLNKMDRHQAIYAEKLINDVIFNGQMGKLTYNTSCSNLSNNPNLPSSNSGAHSVYMRSQTTSPAQIVYEQEAQSPLEFYEEELLEDDYDEKNPLC